MEYNIVSMLTGMKKLVVTLIAVLMMFTIIVIRNSSHYMEHNTKQQEQLATPNKLNLASISPHHHIVKQGIKQHGGSWEVDLLSAVEVRQKMGLPSGPYLGTGYIPQMFTVMDLSEAQTLFHSNMVLTPYKCSTISRFGNPHDGGYDVCVDQVFIPQKNKCLVYSFGIRNEWSFDDHINKVYGCEVHSFDPSMNQTDHMHKEPNMHYYNLGIWGSNIVNDEGWKLQDLATIIKSLGHENRVIDYLKIDVEAAEWPLLTHLVTSGIHKQVKQMALELHTPRWKIHGQRMAPVDYGEIYHGLKQLEKLGFQKFRYHAANGCCGRFVTLTTVNNKQLCCYETFYVNTNFIT